MIAPEPWKLDARWPGDLRVPTDWIKLYWTERPAPIPAYPALRRSRVSSTTTMVLASPADPDDKGSLRGSLSTGIDLTVLAGCAWSGGGCSPVASSPGSRRWRMATLKDRFDVAFGAGGAICLIAAAVLLMTARSAAGRQPVIPDGRGHRITSTLRVSPLAGIDLTVLRRVRLVGWGLLASCVVSWVAALGDGDLADRFDVALGVGGGICLIAATVLFMTPGSAAVRPADRL